MIAVSLVLYCLMLLYVRLSVELSNVCSLGQVLVNFSLVLRPGGEAQAVGLSQTRAGTMHTRSPVLDSPFAFLASLALMMCRVAHFAVAHRAACARRANWDHSRSECGRSDGPCTVPR